MPARSRYGATRSASGQVCCAASCGQCDSVRCSKRPGGWAHCCPNAILKQGRYCSSSADTACIVHLVDALLEGRQAALLRQHHDLAKPALKKLLALRGRGGNGGTKAKTAALVKSILS